MQCAGLSASAELLVRHMLSFLSHRDKLQHLLNAAARLVTGTHDHGLSRLLHGNLHWLDVPERIQ